MPTIVEKTPSSSANGLHTGRKKGAASLPPISRRAQLPDVASESGDVRKMRWGRASSGKSSGVLVI